MGSASKTDKVKSHLYSNDLHHHNQIHCQTPIEMNKNFASSETNITTNKILANERFNKHIDDAEIINKLEFGPLDKNVHDKISQANMGKMINDVTNMLGINEQTTIEKLGFDIISGNPTAEVNHSSDGIIPSKDNSLMELAAWAGGNADKQESYTEEERQTSEAGSTKTTRVVERSNEDP